MIRSLCCQRHRKSIGHFLRLARGWPLAVTPVPPHFEVLSALVFALPAYRFGERVRPAWLTSRLSAWCVAVLAKRITSTITDRRGSLWSSPCVRVAQSAEIRSFSACGWGGGPGVSRPGHWVLRRGVRPMGNTGAPFCSCACAPDPRLLLVAVALVYPLAKRGAGRIFEALGPRTRAAALVARPHNPSHGRPSFCGCENMRHAVVRTAGGIEDLATPYRCRATADP